MKTKPKVIMSSSSSIVLSVQDGKLMPMYKAMYSELDAICNEYNAVIDLSVAGQLVIRDTSRRCRKRIRTLYGGCNFFRTGSTLEMYGFNGD